MSHQRVSAMDAMKGHENVQGEYREGIRPRSEPWGIPTFKGQEAEESRRLRMPKKQENLKSSFTEIKEGEHQGRRGQQRDRQKSTRFAMVELADGKGGLGNNSVKREEL